MSPILKLQGCCRWLIPLLTCFLAAPLGVYAREESAELERVNAIKAAFVLNIARFVVWPSEVYEGGHKSFHLCIYRDNSYGQAFSSIEGKKIGQHPVELITIQQLDDDKSCEILLIPHSELESFGTDVKGKLKRPILTIADNTKSSAQSSNAREGIIVNLVRRGSRIAFEIDPWLARSVNLQMSSELLKLARIVGKDS